MRNRHRPGLRAGAAVLAAGLLAASCGSSSKKAATSPSTSAAASASTTATSTVPPAGASGSTSTGAVGGGTANVIGPGVTATEIKLGEIATVSGPVPGIFQKSVDSMDAFAAYVNAQGGIDGRRLVMVHKDDAYSCVVYTNDLKALSTQVFAMVGSFSVEDGCGVSVLKANPNFPNIEAIILDPTVFSAANAFAGATQPPGYATTGYQYVKDKYPADITHVGSIYPTSATFSQNEQHTVAKTIGYKFVYTRGVGVTDTNFTSDILRMKTDGVKIVDLLSDPVNVAAAFEQQAAQQGFKPDAVLTATAYDSNFVKLLGSNTSVANNVIAPLYFPMYLGEDAPTNPALATYLNALDKLHPGEKTDLFGTTSWAAGLLFAQAMHAAGAGGAIVTQAGLIKAITNLGSFTADGMMPPSNPGKRVGANCEVIVGVHNGTFVRLDPPTSGFECNGTYVNLPASALG